MTFPAYGTLSDSALEITVENGGGYIIGQFQLHR